MAKRPLIITGRPAKPFSEMTNAELEEWLRVQYRRVRGDQASEETVAFHLPGKHNQKSHARGGAANGAPSGREERSNAAAKQVLGRAAAVEPELTDSLTNLSAAAGGRMEGLQHRLKTEASLTRKIRDKSAQKGMEPEEYAARVGDAVRYTTILPTDRFGDGAASMVDGLKSRGYDVNEIENTWHVGNTYRGLHATIAHPSGVKAEIQFHTPESIAVKNRIHADYEIARLPETPVAERKAANRRMIQAWDGVPTPAGIERFQPALHRPVDLKQGLTDVVEQATLRARDERR